MYVCTHLDVYIYMYGSVYKLIPRFFFVCFLFLLEMIFQLSMCRRAMTCIHCVCGCISNCFFASCAPGVLGIVLEVSVENGAYLEYS